MTILYRLCDGFYKEENIRGGEFGSRALGYKEAGGHCTEMAHNELGIPRKNTLNIYLKYIFKRFFNVILFVIFTDLPLGVFHIGRDISNLVWESSGGPDTIQLGEEEPFIWEPSKKYI